MSIRRQPWFWEWLSYTFRRKEGEIVNWVESGIWNGILVLTETVVLALCTWYFLSHTKQNVNGKRMYRCAAALAYWVGLAGITLGMQSNRYINLVLLAYMVAMTIITGFWLYHRGGMYCFYYFLFPVSLVTAQICVIYVVFAYMSSRRGILIFDYTSANVALIIKQLTEILLTGVWIVLLNRKKYESVSGIRFAGLFLPPAVSMFITFSLIYIGDVYVQLYGSFLIILDIFFLVFMNLYIWHLFSYQSKNRKLKTELEIRKKHSEMQYQYYEKVEQKYQSTRKMIHDMRNHLQAIEALQEQDEAQAIGYVRDMHQMLDNMGIVNFTDNRILNIILNDKAEEAEKNGIGMEIQIGEIHLGHMKDMDMTTIFGNLLDNALEAAGQAERERKIQIRADTFHEFTVVKIHNSMRTADTARQDNGASDAGQNIGASDLQGKRGGKSHMGIGLENVRRTLEKYGGGFMAEAVGDEFSVNITIPKKEEER